MQNDTSLTPIARVRKDIGLVLEVMRRDNEYSPRDHLYEILDRLDEVEARIALTKVKEALDDVLDVTSTAWAMVNERKGAHKTLIKAADAIKAVLEPPKPSATCYEDDDD